jgi:hypothetical protein
MAKCRFLDSLALARNDMALALAPEKGPLLALGMTGPLRSLRDDTPTTFLKEWL